MSTIPGDFEAWWLGPGLAFNSHPLSNGDVAWEAQVNSSSLASIGYTWDAASHSLLPLGPDHSGSPDNSSPDSLRPDHSSSSSNRRQQQHAAQRHTGGLVGGGANGMSEPPSPLQVSSAAAGGSFDAARGAAAPAGELEPQAGEATVMKPAAAASAAAASGDGAVKSNRMNGRSAAAKPSQALLLQLFHGFPAPVLDMIAATSPASLLEAAVLTRPARNLPHCLGRGGVVVLGEAAHPLRPSGQEISQAFEDAAELGAAVMACGVSRDALRRLEMRRRPRWRHIIQVSQALGACSNLGGVSLHQGLLDYTAQLYRVSFVPLRSQQPARDPQRKRLLRRLGYVLLAWGAAAGVQALRQRGQLRLGGRRPRDEALGPIGAVLATVGDAGEAAGKLIGEVSSAAVALPGGMLKAAKVGAHAEKGLQHGIGNAAAAVVDIAEEAAGKDSDDSSGDGVVRGWVPPRSSGHQRNPAARLKDAVIGRTMSIGGVLSRPFTKFVRHRAVQTVADQLGAF
ncbi:hypothetical protein COO60DRAFT_286528 [Scenedesmus sp. NREL 46B-D3]|nr:hypothetical protein COO60DRAFT_286528 [Scenedesmus sp. NREL 46B-D3]